MPSAPSSASPQKRPKRPTIPHRTSSATSSLDSNALASPSQTTDGSTTTLQINSQELQFPLANSHPRLPLSANPASHTSMDRSRPTTPTSMDEATDSEDTRSDIDSTYEIISASSFRSRSCSSSDEDELHERRDDDGAESARSFSLATPCESDAEASDGEDGYGVVHVPDAAAAVVPSETDEGFDEDGRSAAAVVTPMSVYTPEELEVEEQLATPSLVSSTVRGSTVVEASGARSHEEWIRFREPIERIADGLVDVTKPGSDEPLPTGLRLIMAQAAVGDGPAVKKLRVFYCGPRVHKHRVVEKIAQALAAPRRAEAELGETMNVVQVGGFEGISKPLVMLIPSSGLELEIVDWDWRSSGCSINHTLTASSAPSLTIFVHQTPDLPSFLYSSLRASAKSTSPVLDISLKADFETAIEYHARQLPFKPWRNLAVHLATDVRTSRSNLVKIPIDIESFLNLDPTDLSRNITCMLVAPETEQNASNQCMAYSQLVLKHIWTVVLAIFTRVTARLYNFHSYLDHKGVMQTIEDIGLVSPRKICNAWNERSWTKLFKATGGYAWVALLALILMDFVRLYLGNDERYPVQAFGDSQAVWFPQMIQEHLQTSSTSQDTASPTISDRSTSLSVVPSEKGLVALSTVSKPRHGWFSREQQWKFLQDDDERLFLTHSQKIKQPLLVHLSTPMAQEYVTLGPTESRAREGSGVVFERLNASALALKLPSPPYCGTINITVHENCTRPHFFTFDRSCEEPNITKEFQRFYDQHLRWPYEDTVQRLQRLSSLSRDGVTDALKWLDTASSFKSFNETRIAEWTRTAQRWEEIVDAKALTLYEDALAMIQEAAQRAQPAFKSLKEHHEASIRDASKRASEQLKALSNIQPPSMSKARSRAISMVDRAKQALRSWNDGVERTEKKLRKVSEKMVERLERRRERRIARMEARREKRNAHRND